MPKKQDSTQNRWKAESRQPNPESGPPLYYNPLTNSMQFEPISEADQEWLDAGYMGKAGIMARNAYNNNKKAVIAGAALTATQVLPEIMDAARDRFQPSDPYRRAAQKTLIRQLNNAVTAGPHLPSWLRPPDQVGGGFGDFRRRVTIEKILSKQHY